MKTLIALFACCTTLLFAAPVLAEGEPVAAGVLTGKFMNNMGEGLAFFYNHATGPAPDRAKYWRIPDYSAPLDATGKFTAQLPPGEYYVAGLKRLAHTGPVQIGPPLENDLFVPFLDKQGRPVKIALKSSESKDLGIIKDVKKKPDLSRITAIEGIVLDTEGKPVEGALALAFTSPRVVGKPQFTSDRSDKEGKFLLRVHQGGTYYLKLRNSFGGGRPEAGAVLDGNKQQPLAAVLAKTGEIVTGVTLTGKAFTGRGPTENEGKPD